MVEINHSKHHLDQKNTEQHGTPVNIEDGRDEPQ